MLGVGLLYLLAQNRASQQPRLHLPATDHKDMFSLVLPRCWALLLSVAGQKTQGIHMAINSTGSQESCVMDYSHVCRAAQ